MRGILIILLLSILPGFLFAEIKATISEISGKVEIKALGADSWKPATIGAVIEAGTTVSTGFKSAAVLKLGDTSLTVKALTRLSLKDLVEKSGTVDTNLYLTVGKVKADVKPIAGKTQTFTVASPVSTASVRGTAFDFDGVNLSVQRGQVNMANSLGFVVPVTIGESAAANPESSTGEVQGVLSSYLVDSGVKVDLKVDNKPADLASALAQTPNVQDVISQVASQTNLGQVKIKINY
jgi:hypothetical protein